MNGKLLKKLREVEMLVVNQKLEEAKMVDSKSLLLQNLESLVLLNNFNIKRSLMNLKLNKSRRPLKVVAKTRKRMMEDLRSLHPKN